MIFFMNAVKKLHNKRSSKQARRRALLLTEPDRPY